MSICLGIDIGTSGIRTAIVDDAGAVISTAHTNHILQDETNINADLWWQSVQSCLAAQRLALADLGLDLTCVDRIGVDGTSGTMVLTDAHVTPVTKALMYNSTGFFEEAAKIARHAPEGHITQGSNSALARALHLIREDTEGSAVHLLHQSDFITAKLMGVGGHSDENNTLKLGYDPETQTWPDWFAACGMPPALLPEIHPAGSAIGGISTEVASSLGFKPDAVVHAGTTDSIAAFIAAAPLVAGTAVTSLGTTLAIKMLAKCRIDDPSIGLYSHRLGDDWLIGGASNTGGGVLAHLFTPDELHHLSGQIDAAVASPLDYYPLLKPGERFPVNDPDLAPRMEPRPAKDADYLHGLLESIARIEHRCYREIVARGGQYPDTIFTAGGGAQNHTWSAIRSRVLGLKVSNATTSQAAVGVAKLIGQ